MATEPKRPYDGSKRRERAEQERRATQRRVVQAAQRLFVAKGYTATTMTDIAEEAGVAMQSVYKAGTSKADLLQRVIDVVVAGDDDEIAVLERPSFTDIAKETDPTVQVQRLAALIASIQERSAPVQVAYREAAATDDTVAANLDGELRRRHETFTALLGMLPHDRLRLSPTDTVDTAWAIGSSEVFLLLRVRRGWDADHYLEWLSSTLVDLLLTPES
jgi:TetR/AcrR family transcriptional regulator of autoinduction and epiphytic fitness